VAIEHFHRRPRQDRGHHLDVAASLGPGTQDRHSPRFSGATAGEQPQRNATDRRGSRGGDARCIHDPRRQPGFGVVEHDETVDCLQSGRPVFRICGDPLQADEVAVAQPGRHRVDQCSFSWMDADLGRHFRSAAPAAQGTQGALCQIEALVDIGKAAVDLSGREVAQRSVPSTRCCHRHRLGAPALASLPSENGQGCAVVDRRGT
jgi:hypothetical protein